MNGEVKSYRLNSPMDWAEFKSMPDDLKVMYIKALRNKYDVPDTHIQKMFGICIDSFIKEMRRLNLLLGVYRGKRKWDKEGFYAWANGVDRLPTPVIEEEPAEDPIQEPVIISDEPEVFVEDDLPFEEPDPIPEEVEDTNFVPLTATPFSGTMDFECPANQALNMLAQVLGQTNCEISIRWRVIPEGDVEDGQA